MTDTDLIDYEGRYEYWEDGVAWELREPGPRHEWPCGRLAELIFDIAKMRGAPIALLGTTGLQERDTWGTRLRAVQADQLVCLDWRYGLPDVYVVGEIPVPDVVFEVDLTTDIRDRKLDVYAAWSVPELWVEVPDADMPSKRKRPGLTIHLLEDGRFRESAESLAFPTLSAREIHAALNEPSTSAATVETARRVGGIMGRRIGTGPDDDPFLSVERRLSHREGHRQGHREGHRQGHHEGHREGRRDERISMLEGLLRARGIDITPTIQAEADRIAALPQDRILRAVLDSTDSDDFLSRTAGRTSQ